MHLCEFIEDCEYNNLAVRILHLLGTEGPKAAKPTKFIRYIYNRVVLENAIVRAAAVTALAKFGVGADASIKASIKILLTRCLDDPDDEVRDRAALNLKLLDNEEAATKFIKNGIPDYDNFNFRFDVFLTSLGTSTCVVHFYGEIYTTIRSHGYSCHHERRIRCPGSSCLD